jgi:hypothetical protein
MSTATGRARTRLRRLASFWRSLDQPVIGRRVPGSAAVGLTGLLLSCVAALVAYRTGSNTWYADSLSHLTIARRIIDSQAPGFQQLGTVWLPLPHLLLIPFVAGRWLWSSGVGASILGAGCAAATATAVYRTAARLGFGRAGRLVAVLVLWTNVSYLYICTTALTEPVLIAAFACTIAGLVHWATAARPMSGGELAVFAGLPAMVAMLSRYEGWVLVVSMVVYIATVEYRRMAGRTEHAWRFIALHRLLPALAAPAFGVLCPFIGVGWWLAYNYATYHDPLEFMTGPYSAWRQQADDIARGIVTTKGNLGISLTVYNWSLWEILGGVVVVAGALGFFLLFFTEGLTTRVLTLGLAFSTYAFMVASLYLGQIVIWNDHSMPPALWNVRFAVSPILFFALGTAALVDRLGSWIRRTPSWATARARRVLAGGPAVVVALALTAQGCWWARDPVTRSPVVAEGHLSLVLRPTKVIDYVRRHYDGGRILMNESAPRNAIIPLVGLPNKDYWNVSTGAGYHAALKAPTTHARWIVVNTALHTDYPDPVYLYMRQHRELFANYTIVAQDGSEVLYHLDRWTP